MSSFWPVAAFRFQNARISLESSAPKCRFLQNTVACLQKSMGFHHKQGILSTQNLADMFAIRKSCGNGPQNVKKRPAKIGKDQKGPHKRGIHDQGDFWKFPLETTV